MIAPRRPDRQIAWRRRPFIGWAALVVFVLLTVATVAVGEEATWSAPDWWYLGPPGVDDPFSGPFEIDVDLGLGFEVAGNAAAGTQATEEITPGAQLEKLISRLFVYRRIHERFILDFDFDASRGEEGFFGDENYYALDYVGGADELVRRASLGNRIVSIPGDRYVDTIAPPGTSVAAVVDTQATVAGGLLSARGIARLGNSELVTLNFVGSRRVFELTARDTEHIRRKHFFLPDVDIDDGSLEVYASSNSGGDIELDGRNFTRLQSPDDFTFDGARAWIHLSSMLSSRDLVVTYTSGGIRVGDAALGQSAFINESGVRENFSATTHLEQFGEAAGIRYLYLNRDGENSYWEHRGVYAFEELSQISEADLVRIDLLLTGLFESNSNYADVITEYIVDTNRGLVIFVPEDAVGFYPRPFPGLFPYTHAVSPGNPFDLANSVYSDLNAAAEADSVNTLRLRFSGELAGFTIDELFIQDSVTVSVAGRELDKSQYSVDEATGVVSIADGIVSPESSVTIRYRRVGDQDGPQALLAAASADWSRDGFTAHGMIAVDAPLPEVVAPALGHERPIQGTGSAELRYDWEAAGGSEVSVALWGGVRIGDPNAHDVALIAGMDDGSERAISLEANEWQLASASSLLPVAPALVGLSRRGDLIFEDFTEDSLIGGGLRTLSWDNSANRSFPYAEKAGPYSTADSMADGEPLSLVMDYRFDGGEVDQYVTIVRSVAGGLDRYDTLEIGFRGDSIAGTPVRLYVELLQTYSEDLDGDGRLDGEASIDDLGFAITPSDGVSTMIGTDRNGESNGILDSEDLNDNGLLDPLGGTGESGQLIPGAADPFVAEIEPEVEPDTEPEWQTVRLDFRALAAVAPGVFEDAEAIRLTVVPSVTPAAASTGRVVINRLVFWSSGMIGSPDGRLSLQTITPETSPELFANPLSETAGETYDDLHGNLSYRESAGMTEQVLEISLIPTLPDGDRTAVSRSLGGWMDLTRYESIALYVYVADPPSLPAELMLDLRFVSTPGDYLTVGIDPAAFNPGWNELMVETEGEMRLFVNGSEVGTLLPVGDHASLAGITDLELGLSAIGGDLVGSVTLWTDDWHARGSRAAIGMSAGGSVEASFAGDLVSFGDYPVLSDPRFALEYEYDGLGIDSPSAGASHTVRADAGLRLAGVFPLSVSGRWSSAPLLSGENTFNLHATAGIDTGVERVPTIEHSFRYAGSVERGFVLSDLEYLEAEYSTAEASVRLSEEVSFAEGWAQHLSGTRSVTRRVDSYSSGAMTDSVAATLAGRGSDPAGWAATATGSFSRSFTGAAADILDSAPLAYTSLMAGLFGPVHSTLTDPRLAGTNQSIVLRLSPAKDVAVGLGLAAEESAAEHNFSSGGSARDITAGGSASFELPVAIGREQRVRIVPLLSRSFSTSVGQATLGHSNWWVLGSSAVPALAVPFAYLTPFSASGRVRERDAVTMLADLLAVAGDPAAVLSTEMELETRIDGDAWYVPSVVAVGAEGETKVQSSTVSQERSISARLSRSVPVIRPERGAGSLVLSSSGSFTRDFLQDTETLHASFTVYYAFSSVTGRSWQVNQNASWTSERQHIDAERLSIFPEDPLREPEPSFLADSHRLVNRSTFQYTWRADRAPSATPSTLARRLGVDGEAQLVINREQISVETSTTFADPASLGTTTLLPLRITLEHSSEVTQTENLSFRLSLLGQGGLEKHVSTGHVDLVPAFGVEFRLGATIRY